MCLHGTWWIGIDGICCLVSNESSYEGDPIWNRTVPVSNRLCVHRADPIPKGSECPSHANVHWGFCLSTFYQVGGLSLFSIPTLRSNAYLTFLLWVKLDSTPCLSCYSSISVHHYNNNRWCSVVYRVLDQRRLFWHTKEKFRNTKRSWVFLIFLKCVKITSVGLKLDRPQLQHWLLFLEHI